MPTEETAIQRELYAIEDELLREAASTDSGRIDHAVTNRVFARRLATLKVRLDKLEKGESDVDDSDQGATEKREDNDGSSDR